jgi:tripeptide aminopeptidase
VLLNTALEIVSRDLPHPPVTFCWFIQEEVGLYGARNVQKTLLGNPKLVFNWDGGSASKLTVGATGAYRLTIRVAGLASHAGVAPQKGVSAIAIAGLAIADLHRNGWHGQVVKPEGTGTSNVGVIQGGEATNVVTDHVAIRAEARSHNPEFRKRIVDEIEAAFQRAAAEVRSAEGHAGSIEFERRMDYESFELPADEPCVLAAESAVQSVGLTPNRAISSGGLDANWMTERGLPAVTLGCGQVAPHTVAEALDIREFELACRIGLRLATGT